MAFVSASCYFNDDIRLLLWKIEESIEQLLSFWQKKDERKNIQIFLNQKFSAESRKKEWLVERILLKQHYPSEVCLKHQENGAPYLLNTNKNISISHTQSYVAVAVSNRLFFGIDIETISERINRVTPYFITEEEVPQDNTDKTLYNLVVWSAKESIFKALRDGVANNMKNIHIPPFSLAERGDFSANINTHPSFHNAFVHYECTGSYVLTIACVS